MLNPLKPTTFGKTPEERAADRAARREERKQKFQDGDVAAAMASLRRKIANLADKDNKPLMTTDYLQFCVKPYLRINTPKTQNLSTLYAGGPPKPASQGGGNYASVYYTWFMHKLAAEGVSDLIKQNIDDIFGDGNLRAKYNTGIATFRQKHPGDVEAEQNYVKRTFSRPIKTWYIANRYKIIDSLGEEDPTTWPRAGELLNTALAAQRSGAPSVGAYLKSRGSARFITSSSSSSSSSSAQPIGFGNFSQNPFKRPPPPQEPHHE